MCLYILLLLKSNEHYCITIIVLRGANSNTTPCWTRGIFVILYQNCTESDSIFNGTRNAKTSDISVKIKDCIYHHPSAYFYDIHGSGHSFTACQSRDAVLRRTRVGTQFYDIPGSGHSLRHTRVGTQFYDKPGSGHSFTAYQSRDAVLRHIRVGTQF